MSKKGEFFFRIAVIIIAIFAIVMLLVLRLEINKLQNEKEALESELLSCSEKINELEENLSRTDKEFVEQTEQGGK